MNNCKPTVAVLMSTYNGEKYLKEQLDSIFSQTGVDVKLYIRDDSSSDNTLHIISQYAEKYPILILNDGYTLGPGASFMKLLYQFAFEPGVEYFAFADQDDIWLDNKLQKGIDAITNSEFSGSVLYSSNQFLYINGSNEGKRHREKQCTTLISHLTRNTISGCTFVFNKELAQLVAKSKHANSRIIKYRLHDAWLMLVAIACGHVIYDEDAYILYRIHDENTVGLKTVSFKQKLGKLQRFWKRRDDANLRMITAKQLLRSFSDIKESDKNVLQLYANYQNSWKDKWALLTQQNILRECEENKVVFRMKILMNFV